MSDPDDDLRALFDRSAEPASPTTLVRLAARAREIPERPRRGHGLRWWAWVAPGLVALGAAVFVGSTGGGERGDSAQTTAAMGGGAPSGTSSGTAGSPPPHAPPAPASEESATNDEVLADLDEVDELGADWLDDPDPWANDDDEEDDAWLDFEDG
ncbi:MAG: hypothetical protein IT376_10025 [Polyangiaceae bacterium]|nr:hypothetical protein [Polyangiaceae bacterium]